MRERKKREKGNKDGVKTERFKEEENANEKE